jgi:hypothetical protein
MCLAVLPTSPSSLRRDPHSGLNPTIKASVQNNGLIHFRVGNELGLGRGASLELDEHDNPGIYLYDGAGEPRSSLALDKEGNPDISLFDTWKRIRADLKLDTDGNPSLTLSDAKQTRAVLGSSYLKNATTGSTEHRSPSSLVLFREDGKLLWSAP